VIGWGTPIDIAAALRYYDEAIRRGHESSRKFVTLINTLDMDNNNNHDHGNNNNNHNGSDGSNGNNSGNGMIHQHGNGNGSNGSVTIGMRAHDTNS
jgi:hypothetical protein